MIRELMYVELKSGYNDDGPAWIGYVKASRTYRTIYFNDHAFQRVTGYSGNYVDIENGDIYWITGAKNVRAIGIGPVTERSWWTRERWRNIVRSSVSVNFRRRCSR